MVSVPILWPSPSQKTSGKHDEKESLVWEHCPARSGFSSLSSAAIDYHRAISNVFQIPHVRLAMTHMTIVAKSPHGLQVEPHSFSSAKAFPSGASSSMVSSQRNSPIVFLFVWVKRSSTMSCQKNTVQYSSLQFSTVQYSSIYSSSQIFTNLHIRPNYELLLTTLWALISFFSHKMQAATQRLRQKIDAVLTPKQDCSTDKHDIPPKWVCFSNYKYCYCAKRKENWWKKCRCCAKLSGQEHDWHFDLQLPRCMLAQLNKKLKSDLYNTLHINFVKSLRPRPANVQTFAANHQRPS